MLLCKTKRQPKRLSFYFHRIPGWHKFYFAVFLTFAIGKRDSSAALRMTASQFFRRGDSRIARNIIENNATNKKKTERVYAFGFPLKSGNYLSSQGLAPSTFGVKELNFCVRNGNRWILFAIITAMVYIRRFQRIISKINNYIANRTKHFLFESVKIIESS